MELSESFNFLSRYQIFTIARNKNFHIVKKSLDEVHFDGFPISVKISCYFLLHYFFIKAKRMLQFPGREHAHRRRYSKCNLCLWLWKSSTGHKFQVNSLKIYKVNFIILKLKMVLIFVKSFDSLHYFKICQLSKILSFRSISILSLIWNLHRERKTVACNFLSSSFIHHLKGDIKVFSKSFWC